MNCFLIKDQISIGNVAMQSMQIFKLLFLIFIYYEHELKFRTLYPSFKYNYYCEKWNNYGVVFVLNIPYKFNSVNKLRIIILLLYCYNTLKRKNNL